MEIQIRTRARNPGGETVEEMVDRHLTYELESDVSRATMQPVLTDFTEFYKLEQM